MNWQHLAGSLATGVTAGAAFWVVARLGILFPARSPWKPPFAEELLAHAGDRDRLRHRDRGRELAILLAAFLAVLIVTAMGVLLNDAQGFASWPLWVRVSAVVACIALLGLGAYRAFMLMKERRRARYAWAASAAVGNILERLNFAGNRVFHEVHIEHVTIDHVVVGARGVFAINVVPRPLPRKADGRPTAELKNGKLKMAETVEAMPVGDAARNMTVLTAALTRVVGHRVPVRSVLAVPGWHSVPSDASNHLVLNDRNLVMLTSWTKPDAFLMDEDCASIQAFLQKASRVPRLE